MKDLNVEKERVKKYMQVAREIMKEIKTNPSDQVNVELAKMIQAERHLEHTSQPHLNLM